MWIYYMMFLFPAAAAMVNARENSRPHAVTWGLAGTVLVFLLGFRMCGGDWNNYFQRFQNMAYDSLGQALHKWDLGYQLISYYMYRWDLGFMGVTVLCAILSVTGLMVFLRRRVNPWLGLAVAMPYLVIVVYMGYMRQGVALGLVLWGIAFLEQGRFMRFIAMVALAVTFHKTAILMIAFGVFQQGRGKVYKMAAVLFAGLGAWFSFVGDAAFEQLYTNYVESGMESSGALIRVALNALPALLLFLYRKQWKEHFSDYGFWRMVALASLAAVPLVGLASTAVDRMALYFIPLQIVVFSRLPFFMRNVFAQRTTTFLVLLLYFMVLTIWINLGSFSMWWLPYRNFVVWSLFGP